MVRSFVRTRKGPAVGMYIVMVRKHMTSYLLPDVEKEVKKEILRVGRSINRSGYLASPVLCTPAPNIMYPHAIYS